MKLKLTRSQRQGGVISKNVIFCLDARADLTNEEQENVVRYKLGKQVIYNSEASKRHLTNTATALATGSAMGVAKGALSFAMSALNLNITIDDLQHGQYIECKTLDELMGAEEAIKEACLSLKSYLDTAATFDGTPIIIDYSDGEPRIVAPSYTPPPQLAAPTSPATPNTPPPPHLSDLAYEPARSMPDAGSAPMMGMRSADAYDDHSEGGFDFDQFREGAFDWWRRANGVKRLLACICAFFVVSIAYHLVILL